MKYLPFLRKKRREEKRRDWETTFLLVLDRFIAANIQKVADSITKENLFDLEDGEDTICPLLGYFDLYEAVRKLRDAYGYTYNLPHQKYGFVIEDGKVIHPAIDYDSL